jgi:hypothetical protein
MDKKVMALLDVAEDLLKRRGKWPARSGDIIAVCREVNQSLMMWTAKEEQAAWIELNAKSVEDRFGGETVVKKGNTPQPPTFLDILHAG